MLINDQRVTAKAIEELKLGYDISLFESEGHYHECFKYSCKGAFDPDKGAFLYNEQTFKILYQALYNRRMIQGYGLLHNFDDMDGDLLEGYLVEEYEKIIAALKDFEKPIYRVEDLDEIIDCCVNKCKYISKSNLRRYLEDKRGEIMAKELLSADMLNDFFSKPMREVLGQTLMFEEEDKTQIKKCPFQIKKLTRGKQNNERAVAT